MMGYNLEESRSNQNLRTLNEQIPNICKNLESNEQMQKRMFSLRSEALR
jgi:hypothetical protein